MVIAPPGVGNQHVPMAQTSLSDDEPPPLEAVEVSIFVARIIAVVYIFLSPAPPSLRTEYRTRQSSNILWSLEDSQIVASLT